MTLTLFQWIQITVWGVLAVSFILSQFYVSKLNSHTIKGIQRWLDDHEEREEQKILVLGTALDRLMRDNNMAHNDMVRTLGRLEGRVNNGAGGKG